MAITSQYIRGKGVKITIEVRKSGAMLYYVTGLVDNPTITATFEIVTPTAEVATITSSFSTKVS